MNSRARHCLKCGTPLRPAVEDGQRRRRCPRCGWIFYDNPAPATAAIVSGPRGILLARRARPPYADTWDLPGGFLESGEAPDRGLLRELREELGAAATITRLTGIYCDHYGPGGFPILTLAYLVRLRGSARARSDVSEIRWFPRGALPWGSIAFPSLRRALRDYLTGRASGIGGRRSASPRRVRASQ